MQFSQDCLLDWPLFLASLRIRALHLSPEIESRLCRAFEQTKRKFWLTDNTNKVHGKQLKISCQKKKNDKKIPCLVQPAVIVWNFWNSSLLFYTHYTLKWRHQSYYTARNFSLSLPLSIPPPKSSLEIWCYHAGIILKYSATAEVHWNYYLQLIDK